MRLPSGPVFCLTPCRLREAHMVYGHSCGMLGSQPGASCPVHPLHDAVPLQAPYLQIATAQPGGARTANAARAEGR